MVGNQLVHGRFWAVIGRLNGNFNGLGFIIIGVFIFAWIASILVYRYARLDDLDLRSAKG